MAGLCATIGNFAGIFLLLAAIAALFETAIMLVAKWQALRKAPKDTAAFAGPDADGLAKVLAALKDLLLALKDLPAWIALFLAGLALVWTAAAAPNLCSAAQAEPPPEQAAGE